MMHPIFGIPLRRIGASAAIAIALLFAGARTGWSAEQISLSDAVEVARAQNPDLAAAAQEVAIAAGELKRAGYLTPFNAESDDTANYRTRTARSNTQDWRISMVQQFEIFGQRSLRMKSAETGYDRASAELRDRVRLLTAAVKLTFLDAMRARRRLDLLGQLEQLDRRLLDAARTRLNAGEIGQIEFNLTQVRYGESHRALIDGREIYRLQRSSLGRLLGDRLGPEPEPSGDYRPEPLGISLAELVDRARRNRPDLAARQLELARLETEAALNNRLNYPNPIIGLFGGHELNTERFYGVQFGFSMPIFNWRTGEAAIIAAQQRRASAEVRAASLDVEREVRDAYYQYETAYQALRVYDDEIVAPARESFGLLERAFTEGKIDLLRLAVAEREAFEAQNGYLDAWFGVLAARVAMELATGSSL
jgi:cobalt-zinc-cadmium efflux system outer membrane protein